MSSSSIKNPTFANKKYDYVRSFETDDKLMPQCYIVCRIDGKNFHRFSALHNFQKPNDIRALALMNQAAVSVVLSIKDIVLAYGQSDEYSFVFNLNTKYVSRRSSKIVSHVVSTFSSAYTYYWPRFFGRPSDSGVFNFAKAFPTFFPTTTAAANTLELHSETLKELPNFDGRTIVYPNYKCLRDYLSWRQVDCHVNNLYNTTFWSLVLTSGLTTVQAQQRLECTVSGDKNEILFSQFGINYNEQPQVYRKGTLLLKRSALNPKYLAYLLKPDNKAKGSGKGKKFDFYHNFFTTLSENEDLNGDLDANLNPLKTPCRNGDANSTFAPNSPFIGLHMDLIGDEFWDNNPDIFEVNNNDT